MSERRYAQLSFLVQGAEIPYRLPFGVAFEIDHVERLLGALRRGFWHGLRVDLEEDPGPARASAHMGDPRVQLRLIGAADVVLRGLLEAIDERDRKNRIFYADRARVWLAQVAATPPAPSPYTSQHTSQHDHGQGRAEEPESS